MVEVLYLSRAAAWQEKGRTKVTLPALDLPVSRTGLLLYYPPLFRVTAEPGSFRTQPYENPTSAVLSPASGGIGAGFGGGIGSASPAAKPMAPEDRKDKRDATQALLDSFRAKSAGGKVTGILPVNVQFPAFGPSIFLVSQLTGENQAPAAAVSFQREKKGGAR